MYEKYLHDNQGNISEVTIDSFGKLTIYLKNNESKSFDLLDLFGIFEDFAGILLSDLRYYHVPSIKKV